MAALQGTQHELDEIASAMQNTGMLEQLIKLVQKKLYQKYQMP